MKLSRRQFSKTIALTALGPWGCSTHPPKPDGVLVNDSHSQLNPTQVDRIALVTSVQELQGTVARAASGNQPVSIAGGRHAMGGQQFGSGTILIDTTQLQRVIALDAERGIIEVEAGIEWPALIRYLTELEVDAPQHWGIAQKQTGADRLTLGGALAANAHGRGLRMKPFVSNVESFQLIDAKGDLQTCSREQNSELFSLAAGGYGLFGIVSSIKLRLTPRAKLRRVVEVIGIDELMPAFESRIADGFLYGDCQFSIDEKSEDFLKQGVFSCYQPVDAGVPVPTGQKQLSDDNWNELLYLAHADKGAAFRRYSEFYLATSGQIYWSDTHQLSAYLDDYHRALDKRLGSPGESTEIITEIYVPRADLTSFMEEAAEDFRAHAVNVIYGTIRLIERDDDSFLAWAKQPYACVIFNLHTPHTPEGLEHSAEAFRRLIDMAIRRSGSYFLTYHRYARRGQVEACYPRFQDFLRLKKQYDPQERFQSDWYRHYREVFA